MAEDPSQRVRQDEIEELLKQTQMGAGLSSAPASRSPATARGEADSDVEPGMAPQDIELLLHQAERALASMDDPSNAKAAGARPFALQEFGGAPVSQETATLELLRDVELDLKIELGRTHMYLEEVLKLRKGSVVPLDKLAGDPVDIYVNGRLIARGEVLVLNDNFCVRVAELVAGEGANE
jgi:flagellar motor switch protein FliN